MRFTHFPILCVPRGSSEESNWLRCETHHSPPPTFEVKNEWSYNPPPSIFLQGLHMINFTLHFLVFVYSRHITETDSSVSVRVTHTITQPHIAYVPATQLAALSTTAWQMKAEPSLVLRRNFCYLIIIWPISFPTQNGWMRKLPFLVILLLAIYFSSFFRPFYSKNVIKMCVEYNSFLGFQITNPKRDSTLRPQKEVS